MIGSNTAAGRAWGLLPVWLKCSCLALLAVALINTTTNMAFGAGFDFGVFPNSSLIWHMKSIKDSEPFKVQGLSKYLLDAQRFERNHTELDRESQPRLLSEQISPLFTTNSSSFRSACGGLVEALESHILNVQLSTSSNNCVVWRCTGECGGLGDRLRGMYGSFLLALVLQRKFFMMHPPASRFSEFLNSPLYPSLDWSYRSYYGESFSHTSVYAIDILTPVWSSTDWERDNANIERIFIDINQDPLLHLLENPHIHSRIKDLALPASPEAVRGCLLNVLAQPTEKLQRTLARVLPELRCDGCVFVALQMRTGGASTTWSDPVRVPAGSTGDFFTCALLMEEKLLQRPGAKRVRWLVTSDSEAVLRQGRERGAERVVELEGEIVHIDRSASLPETGLTRTYADHTLLAMADILIGSPSGFSELAADRAFHRMLVWPQFTKNNYQQCRGA
eukprot:m.61423 g.61423  ORF g.61423 m.61423 type:complete len:449 (+) comp12347_c0_seq1:78-1424(+)